MGNTYFRTLARWSIVVGVAAFVTFVGFQFAQGDEPEPEQAEQAPPPGFVTPPPDLPTPPPLDRRLFPPPPKEPTPPPLTSLTINGIEVPLAPGVRYGDGGSRGPPLPGSGFPPPETQNDRYYSIMYDKYPERVGTSSVFFDDGPAAGSYVLLQYHILPEDQAIFQPVLDALQ